jgi:hypothetical protein
MRKFAQMMNSTRPIPAPQYARSIGMSRTQDSAVDAGRRLFSEGNCSASTAKEMPKNACRMIFARASSPRDRAREILMKSSRKPTRPMPTIR